MKTVYVLREDDIRLLLNLKCKIISVQSRICWSEQCNWQNGKIDGANLNKLNVQQRVTRFPSAISSFSLSLSSPLTDTGSRQGSTNLSAIWGGKTRGRGSPLTHYEKSAELFCLAQLPLDERVRKGRGGVGWGVTRGLWLQWSVTVKKRED